MKKSKKRAYKHWTTEEVARLKEIYPKTRMKDLQLIFGRSKLAVEAHVKKLGLKKEPEYARGRPSKLLNIDLKQVESLAGLGLTGVEIAEILNINLDTLYEWQKKPIFSETLSRGKTKADATVIKSLFKQAIERENVTAQIFWLKNRRWRDWKDRQDIEHTGEIGLYKALSVEEKLELERLQQKRLKDFDNQEK